MMNVNVEAKVLLDKLYNLRSKDSVILLKMEDERNIAQETKNRTADEKVELASKVKELCDEEILLAKEGDLLKEALKNINKESFGLVFSKLNIDFDPMALNEKVEAVLPSAINGVKEEIVSSKENLESILKEMNDAITKIDELGIRKDEALSNQSKLNEYIKLALDGNINITRDAITTLLSKFELSKEEQRECAKLLMFPEDGLYEYDENCSSKSGKSFSDVFAEAKGVAEPVVTPIVLDVKIEEPNVSPSFEEPIFDQVEMDVPIFEPIELETPVVEEEIAPIEIAPIEITPFSVDELENKDEKEDVLPVKIEVEKTTEDVVVENINVVEKLNECGFKVSDFSVSDIKYIEDNFKLNVFNKNINIIKELGLNSDIFTENIELFTDDELEEKLNTLLNVGKVPFDIYLNPNILVKYDAVELKNSITSLKDSGLDPKKVPLMAY